MNRFDDKRVVVWVGEQEIHLGVRDDHRLTLRAMNCMVDTTNIKLDDDQWIHLVGTWSTDAINMNCQLFAFKGDQFEMPSDSVLKIQAANFNNKSFIGRSGNNNSPNNFRGFIDEVMVWDYPYNLDGAQALNSFFDGEHYE